MKRTLIMITIIALLLTVSGIFSIGAFAAMLNENVKDILYIEGPTNMID